MEDGKMVAKLHIDDAQPATVEEHYKLIMAEKSAINNKSFDITKDNLPFWFDDRLFKLGQQYYNKNILSVALSHVLGLLAIMAEPDIVRVLAFTKASSTMCSAYKRYTQTIVHTHYLGIEDINDPNSLFFKSINVIRWKHTMATKMHQKQGFHGIYAKDMVITQFGFVGYSFMFPDTLAMCYTSEEQMGFNHFWRVIGYLLDIPDRINLCRKSPEETVQLCKMILTDRLAIHLRNPSKEFLEVTKNTLDGVWHVNVMLHDETILWVLYTLSGIETSKPLSLYGRLNLTYHRIVLYLLKLPYIGQVVRSFANAAISISYKLILKYSVVAWFTLGKQNSQLCMFPKWKS